MARPVKQGLDYFALDVDFLENIKIRKIKKACGIQGLGILIALLCNIYRKFGYYTTWNDDMRFDVADNVGASDCSVDELVKKAVSIGFFDKNVFERHGILTSGEILFRFLKGCSKRDKVFVRKDLYEMLAERPDLPKCVILVNGDTDTQTPISGEETRVSGCDNPQSKSKVKVKLKNAAAAPACAHVREPETPPPETPPTEPTPEAQVLSPTSLPAYSEIVISPECLERFHAYCEAWNAMNFKIRAHPNIPHYVERFATAEHHLSDTDIFRKVIEHLQKHPKNVVCTGKISLAPDRIYTADFADKVVSGYYDKDYGRFSTINRKPKHGGRYRPNPEDYTGEF